MIHFDEILNIDYWNPKTVCFLKKWKIWKTLIFFYQNQRNFFHFADKIQMKYQFGNKILLEGKAKIKSDKFIFHLFMKRIRKQGEEKEW